MPGKNGWSCSTCTFHHSAPAQRCSMCNALRVSKQQMADFIQGIPIAFSSSKENNSKSNVGKKNNKNASSSSPAVSKIMPAKKRQRRTVEQQLTTLLEMNVDFIQNNTLSVSSSSSRGGDVGGGKEAAANVVTQSNRPPATGTAAISSSFSSSNRGATTCIAAAAAVAAADGACLASSGGTAPPPLPADTTNTSVVTGAVVATHPRPNNNNNNNTLLAMLSPKRQKPPPKQSSLLLLPPPPQQQQQQKQKRRAQRQQQYQPPQNQSILVPSLPFLPGPVPFDPETARDWIFPCDAGLFSKRQYQVDICATAVRHNTLVSLPTGLGKTLIAAVVLYNYHRWFPTGKCIFLATTLPLVQQQVQACFSVMGISVHDTAVLTGKMPPERRVDIWKMKSVFFCTPQTVQKDLEAGRLDASSIVCLVLDEAHRATGDYAYCKIVQYLLNATTTPGGGGNSSTDTTENRFRRNKVDSDAAAAAPAAAKFRLLGLSATPGSTIKAIQAVIDALRINKVEARCDDDADVKQYIHDRQYEAIVVPIVSACRDVERMLNDIIGPLLDHLRSRGVFQQHGNATVAQFSVFSAIKVYETKYGKNADPLGVLPTFYAALKLVGIRSDVHAQGIGVVRSKLLQLKNEPQRGLLKNIVHGPAFQAIWDLVERSTTFSNSNPNSGSGSGGSSSNTTNNSSSMSIADKLVNNPKLVKLREILTVHFQQARVTGQSSRVIVFAQRRDCIAEIVYILQDLAPMIRARYFVGQAKGSNDETATATTPTDQQQQVKGMKQAEQHEAIRQFRDNVFNVLVCTCIGEEGLDIGEVDLIINFEVVKSAIRSIQRVGRTGRKRDGRVVWLVSEGPEQRTFAECKQKERTLGHALKNPNSFSVVPTVPMLPNDPILCERSMNVSSNSHMSQVEGHAEQAKKKKVMVKCQQPRQFSAGAGADRTTTTTTRTASAATTARRKSWRISNDAQARRASVLGMSNRISTYSSQAMKRRITLARRQQQQQNQSTCRSARATLGRCRLGRTTSLLYQFEENNNNTMQEGTAVSENSRHRVTGSARSSDLSLDAFFPLTSTEDHFIKLAWGSAKVPPPAQNSTAVVANNDSSGHPTVSLPSVPTTSENAPRREDAAITASRVGASTREPCQMTTRPPPLAAVVNPYSRPDTKQRVPDHCDMEISNMAGGGGSSVLPAAEEFQLPTPDPSSGEESSDDDDASNDAPCVDFACGTAGLEANELKNHPCAATNTGIDVDLNRGLMIGQVGSVAFPPQDAVTHDDAAPAFLSLNELNHHVAPEKFTGQRDDIGQRLDEGATVPVPAATTKVVAGKLNQHHASESENCGLAVADETIDEGDAFILPLQDSSSDEDSDDDEGDSFDDNTNLSTLRAPRVNASAATETTTVEHPPMGDHPKVRFSLDDSTAFTADSLSKQSLEPDPDEGTELVHVRRQERKTRTIVDTPDSLSFAEPSAVKEAIKPEVRFSLDTTFTTDSLNHHSLEPDLDESAEFLNVRRQGRKTRTIVDTPDTASHKVENKQRFSVGSLEIPLLDTQDSSRKESMPSTDIDDIVCAVCGSANSPEEDPIVLCDGPGGSTVCNLAVHTTCYSASINFNKEWRCYVCLYRFNGGTNQVRCLVCNTHTGLLKRLDSDDWIHSGCRNGEAPNTTAAATSKQARLKKIGRPKKATREKQETGKKRTALSDVPVNVKPASVAANKKKQRRDYCRFLDDEASIDSDDDIDGDEDEEDLLAIEGEEGKHDSFINDSSQLGVYTQDDLDKVDHELHDDVDEEEDATHRAVDAERERMNAFATPLLHRRQKRQSKATLGDNDSSPEDSSSVPSSERGLGKLHFIRSVMEHHRQGGRAEDIEQFFEELADDDEGEESQVDDDQSSKR